jgi:hypothetical protein
MKLMQNFRRKKDMNKKPVEFLRSKENHHNKTKEEEEEIGYLIQEKHKIMIKITENLLEGIDIHQTNSQFNKMSNS